MPNHRFPLSHRLIHSHEFDAVFKAADFRVSRAPFLLLAKRNARGFNRLGMVISKKNVARAVDRNRIKRQIREAFRKIHPSSKQHLDMVLLARPAIASERSLSQMLQKSFDEAKSGKHPQGKRH